MDNFSSFHVLGFIIFIDRKYRKLGQPAPSLCLHAPPADQHRHQKVSERQLQERPFQQVHRRDTFYIHHYLHHHRDCLLHASRH